jgi:protein SCO1
VNPGTRSVAATLLVIVLGSAVLWWGTDGFSAFTAETARRMDILRSPRALPTTILEDQDGRAFTLQDYRGRLLSVEFIYTRCRTLCRSMGMAFKQIREHVPQQSLGRDFALLSISFDPERDDPASLRGYGQAYGADGMDWRIARVRSATDLAPLLQAFGIVVIADGLGGFEHNAAIHLIGRDGRLKLISDINEPQVFAERIATWL